VNTPELPLVFQLPCVTMKTPIRCKLTGVFCFRFAGEANHAEWYQHGNGRRCAHQGEFEVMPKCSECGYLALRSGQEFLEVDDAVRNNGLSTSTQMPRCFMMKEEFAKEAASLPKDRGNLVASQAKEVIQRERGCDRFRKWSLGFTPKEHAEMDMFDRQSLREDARDKSARFHQRFELAIVGGIVPVLLLFMQYMTTTMQVEAAREAARMQVKALMETTTPVKLGEGSDATQKPDWGTRPNPS